MVYKTTKSKKYFSTTLVQKIFFDSSFSWKKFFLKVFKKSLLSMYYFSFLLVNHHIVDL